MAANPPGCNPHCRRPSSPRTNVGISAGIDNEQGTSDMAHPAPGPLADNNPDLTRRVLTDTGRMAWEPSPSGTVWRKSLYRQGGEYGPVTSLDCSGVPYPCLSVCAPGRHPADSRRHRRRSRLTEPRHAAPVAARCCRPDRRGLIEAAVAAVTAQILGTALRHHPAIAAALALVALLGCYLTYGAVAGPARIADPAAGPVDRHARRARGPDRLSAGVPRRVT